MKTKLECHNVFLVVKSHVGVQTDKQKNKFDNKKINLTHCFLLMGKDRILKSLRILIEMTVVACAKFCLLMGLLAPTFAYSPIVLVLLSQYFLSVSRMHETTV
jgi:hypothetical protein